MNPDLIRAILEKRLIEFTYRSGGVRIAEPHDYGIKGGNEWLLVFQLSGASSTSAQSGWKDIRVNGIQSLRILDQRFAGSRGNSTQKHRAWDRLFARVK